MKNLFYCVHLVRMDFDETHMRRFQKMSQYAVDAYKNMQFKLPTVSIREHYFTPDDALMAPLPPDFVDYTKVAIDVCGKLVTLTLNPNMKLGPRIDSCGHDVIEAVNNPNCDPNKLWNYRIGGTAQFRNGQYVGEQFSVGGGVSRFGFFKVDKYNNKILLQNAPKTEYYLEYVSSDVNGGTIVEDRATQAIRLFIKWQIKDNEGAPMNEKIEAKLQFYNARVEYFDQVQMRTLSEWKDAIFQSYYSPK